MAESATICAGKTERSNALPSLTNWTLSEARMATPKMHPESESRKPARFQWTIEKRLEKNSIPEPNSGCLIWTGWIDKGGYGVLRFDGRQKQAHRAAYAATNGPIPANLFVCHKCDVPACINPAHLFLGTNADNIADMVAKGRQRGARGTRNSKAKLTEADVLRIRAATGTQTAIASQFGVSQQTVGRIRAGRIWRDA